MSTTHFSPAGRRAVCGSSVGTSPLPSQVTCQRCLKQIQTMSAAGAHCWAMEAEQADMAVEVVQVLYILTLEKSEADVAKAASHLEYEKDRLAEVAQKAAALGVVR